MQAEFYFLSHDFRALCGITSGKCDLYCSFCSRQVFRTHPYLFQLDFVETSSITRKLFSVTNVKKLLSNTQSC